MSTSSKNYTIALDVMGGDNAPDSVLAGANLVANSEKNVFFLLFGEQEKLANILQNYPNLQKNSKIIDCPEVVSSEEKPSKALRRAKKTSMGRAIDAVKKGEAKAVVSAGNTGALMAISKLYLRSLEGIYRPAIASVMPTISGKVVLLDMGANAETDAKSLSQFALMGDAFAKVVLAKDNPAIGLLNIGSEELKGNENVKEAHDLIRNDMKFLNYYGYVEGDDILKGTTDVVVTDGFTGNVALKAIEGTAKLCKAYLKKGFSSSFFAKIGLIFSGRSIKRVFNFLDPRNYNGAIFLGLNGISVKSHGNADAQGFANAIMFALKLCREDINKKIIDELKISAATSEAENNSNSSDQ